VDRVAAKPLATDERRWTPMKQIALSVFIGVYLVRQAKSG
jgi:hypothetical protein